MALSVNVTLTQHAQQTVPFGQVEAGHHRRGSVPTRRLQEEEVLSVLMGVHPAAMKPRDELKLLLRLSAAMLLLKETGGTAKAPSDAFRDLLRRRSEDEEPRLRFKLTL